MRPLLTIVLMLATLGALPPLALAEAPDRVAQAVDRGVAYLLSQQTPEGSIRDLPNNETAMTSLAIMALASAGHLPVDQTAEGVALRRALEYVLREDRQASDGYFGKADGSRMYGHGITTLMLTEMLGMGVDADQDELIRSRCQKAVDLILIAQRRPKKLPQSEGGWRYTPDAKDADMSVTAWQILALRSAKNCGLDVPKEAIDAALAYVQRSYSAQTDRPGFSYLPTHGPATHEMTCAGMLSLQICDQGQSPMVRSAAVWIKPKVNRGPGQWFYYGSYYSAQASSQLNDSLSPARQQALEESMLQNQSLDGSWLSMVGREAQAGRVYCTTLAMLTLSVKYHYLPIYQR